MKKLLFLSAVSILLVSLLIGCSDRPSNYYIDASKTINTKVGGDFVIALDSNRTTGYEWEADYDENLLSQVETEYTAEKCPGLVGAGGTQYLFFKAINKGNTEITLTYKRSWEESYLEQRFFTVEVR
ncbi:protease inhibitor I42 family protein [Chloroflexota bacterium]